MHTRATLVTLLLIACNGGGGTDRDGDGVPADVDCDDRDASVGVYSFYEDLDQDGFGDESSAVEGCESPAGYSSAGGDCDDEDGRVFPGGAETCDEVDQDCDGLVDESPSDAGTWFEDADGDGVGLSASPIQACSLPEGYATLDGDCDDGEASVYPGATAICGDGLDNDCDGLGDCGLALEGELGMGEAWVRIDGTSGDPIGPELVGGVDLSGDGVGDLVLGMPDVAGDDVGRVYAGPLAGAYSSEEFDWGLHGIENTLASNTAVATGDMNADGVVDILVGRLAETAPQGTTGVVHLALGPIDGEVDLERGADTFTIFGSEDGEAFGSTLRVGDLSGDGLDDLLIGAPNWGFDAEGAIYFVQGPINAADAEVEDLSPSRLTVGLDDAHLGERMDIAPDVNGDGLDDLVLAVQVEGGGAVALIYDDLPSFADVDDVYSASVVLSASDGPEFGASIAGAGDLDGDGYGDVLVSDPAVDSSLNPQAGRVWVLDGHALRDGQRDDFAPTEVSSLSFVGAGRGWEFGISVHGPGDLNGDGLGEVLVGAPDYEQGGDEVGAAFLFTSPYSGATQSTGATWLLVGEDHGDQLGLGVSSISDANGLGLPDLVVFGESNERTSTQHGSLFLIPTDAL